MTTPPGAFGDYQLEIYGAGLRGVLPAFPMAFAELEARAAQALSPPVLSYVAGGAGSEHTQRANVSAFRQWGLIPRMFVGAARRDLSVDLFGMRLPSPVLMAPIGVIGLCAQDGHGDLATAAAAARTGVPMIASTLSVDPLEEVAAQFGGTPGFFQLYTPTDRDLAASLVSRAEAAGYRGIVVTLDTWLTGWRPRDLAASNFPQLRGHCLANYCTDPASAPGWGMTRPATWRRLSQSGPGSSATRSAGMTLDGCARSPRCRCSSRASAIRTMPAAPRTQGWTGSTAQTTVAGKPTAGCRRLIACPPWWTPPTACPSSSIPASAPAPM